MRWIVVEWNQASGQPRVVDDGEMYWTEGEALSVALGLAEDALAIGRREEYTIHEIEVSR
ncbi:hypothetical protein MHM582_2074 [Microbacterium sp. HM58-2]|nr:hypothetical protein MHM582_2074 [Microbacterium sp. HM58-2]